MAAHRPGAAGRIVLKDPVHIRDVDAPGHDVGANQDPAATLQRFKTVKTIHLEPRRRRFLPFQRPKLCKNTVALVFHLSMDAVDGDLLDQRLQGSAEVLHTGTGADGLNQGRKILEINLIYYDESSHPVDFPTICHKDVKLIIHFISQTN